MDQESTSTAGPLGDSSAEPEADAFRGSLEDTVLHSANQFHRWHLELEAARVAETEGKYQQYADTLQQHLTSCRELQQQVGRPLHCCDRLCNRVCNISDDVVITNHPPDLDQTCVLLTSAACPSQELEMARTKCPGVCTPECRSPIMNMLHVAYMIQAS